MSWKSSYDNGPRLARVYETLINLGCDDGSSDSEPTNQTLILLLHPSLVQPILLIDDTAHAMPDSGLGVSFAAEDAGAIRLWLKHYHLSQGLLHSETLTKMTNTFECVRMKRVWKILDIAKRMGDQKKNVGPWGNGSELVVVHLYAFFVQPFHIC